MSHVILISLFYSCDKYHKNQWSYGSEWRHWTLNGQLNDSNNEKVEVGYPSELLKQVPAKIKMPRDHNDLCTPDVLFFSYLPWNESEHGVFGRLDLVADKVGLLVHNDVAIFIQGRKWQRLVSNGNNTIL